MRQYKITSSDTLQSQDNDCVLDPADPIHELKAISSLGGIGSSAALANYAAKGAPVIQGSNKGQIQREQNIKSGTQEWFKLWFGDAR